MADSLDPLFKHLATQHTKIATYFMGNLRIERLEGDLAETGQRE